MGMKITIKYYRDVWQEDDGFTVSLQASDAVIVNLRRQVIAGAKHGHSYAVLSVNDKIEARYYLHAESREWRLAKAE